ncbi:hypothetical protein ACFL0R_06300 [Pseudomonadota bacterium]
MNAYDELLEKIHALENELKEEIQKKNKEFFYEVHRKRVEFEEATRLKHKQLKTKILSYIQGARFSVILTAPIIYSCLLPAVLLDIMVSIYQAICFPIYNIPKVKRSEHLIVDRQFLSYLNIIEKINCSACGYFNGVISYVQEVAARTEQYWCPIKHARKVATIHGRYQNFMDYGDAESYKEKLDEVRREFDDLRTHSDK